MTPELKAKLEQEAEKRLEYLTTIGLEKNVLNDYKKDRLVYYSMRSMGFGALYWMNEMGGAEQEWLDKIKELEEQYNCIVYHATMEAFEFGRCLDLWVICKEDVENIGEDGWDSYKGFTEDNIQYAYVMNLDNPDFSEFGDIGFKVSGGGCLRVG